MLSTIQDRRKSHPLPALAPDVFGQLGHLQRFASSSAPLIPLLQDATSLRPSLA